MIVISLLPVRDQYNNATIIGRAFNWNRESGIYWTELQEKTLKFTADKNVLDVETHTTKPVGYEKFET